MIFFLSRNALFLQIYISAVNHEEQYITAVRNRRVTDHNENLFQTIIKNKARWVLKRDRKSEGDSGCWMKSSSFRVNSPAEADVIR